MRSADPKHATTAQAWVPEWPVPSHVKAMMTTRCGGVSQAPFDSLNLGDHVQDDPACVQSNRQQVAKYLGATPVFLNQVHGVDSVRLHSHTRQGTTADASLTTEPNLACTVLVADCLPVLLCDSAGSAIGAAHAGWRGLSGVGAGEGVLPLLLKRFLGECQGEIAPVATKFNALQVPAPHVMAWLGPCIGPTAFEVGEDVRMAFLADTAGIPNAAHCFEPVRDRPGYYRCDLAALARQQLSHLGVTHVYGNNSTPSWCTVSQPSVWFSHRRDAARLGTTGRMAACICLCREGV